MRKGKISFSIHISKPCCPCWQTLKVSIISRSQKLLWTISRKISKYNYYYNFQQKEQNPVPVWIRQHQPCSPHHPYIVRNAQGTVVLLLPGICAKQNQGKRKTCRIISCWNPTGCFRKGSSLPSQWNGIRKWWSGTKSALHPRVQCDKQKANTNKVFPYSNRSLLLCQQWNYLSQLSQRTSSPVKPQSNQPKNPLCLKQSAQLLW